MKLNTCLYFLVTMLAMAACGEYDTSYVDCWKNPSIVDDNTYNAVAQEQWRDSVYSSSALRSRHRDSRLKILAIGNSFSNNATIYMPWLISRLEADSICIARITYNGSTLEQHWNFHVKDAPVYGMYYNEGGIWMTEDLATIDDALMVMDWDIITIQQGSASSGKFSTYQPWLDNLVRLFHEANPHALIAWHATWPYRTGCDHPGFAGYDNDSEKMYDAILDAAGKAAEGLDVTIPSTELIWRMRQSYPEVSDGFSQDGIHITDDHARFALATLWYEVLITPYTGHSPLSMSFFGPGLDADFLERALKIVGDLTGSAYYDQ